MANNLREFCEELAEGPFFTDGVRQFNTRGVLYFNLVVDTAIINSRGFSAKLGSAGRRVVFPAQPPRFDEASLANVRLKRTFDFLAEAFPSRSNALNDQYFVQSVIILALALVRAGANNTHAAEFRSFVEEFKNYLDQHRELNDPDPIATVFRNQYDLRRKHDTLLDAIRGNIEAIPGRPILATVMRPIDEPPSLWEKFAEAFPTMANRLQAEKQVDNFRTLNLFVSNFWRGRDTLLPSVVDLNERKQPYDESSGKLKPLMRAIMDAYDPDADPSLLLPEYENQRQRIAADIRVRHEFFIRLLLTRIFELPARKPVTGSPIKRSADGQTFIVSNSPSGFIPAQDGSTIEAILSDNRNLIENGNIMENGTLVPDAVWLLRLLKIDEGDMQRLTAMKAESIGAEAEPFVLAPSRPRGSDVTLLDLFTEHPALASGLMKNNILWRYDFIGGYRELMQADENTARAAFDSLLDNRILRINRKTGMLDYTEAAQHAAALAGLEPEEAFPDRVERIRDYEERTKARREAALEIAHTRAAERRQAQLRTEPGEEPTPG